MIVNVKQGSLKGGVSKSILTGKEYYYFTGIPYAEPPVGDLRFQEPVPKTRWQGVRDATRKDLAKCVQVEFNGDHVVGEEDCLYLNVYTPERPNPNATLKPVMVYIHGGGFSYGSGNTSPVGPDFLINYDIVLVTMNYRLQALGFLNLNIPGCRGNCGLKDQCLALKWVKENIKEFGGDPNNVTVFGESAGSTCTHYHLISPMSKGLVKRGIVQSGGAFVAWNITDETEDKAFRLGKILGYSGNDPDKLLTFLKKQTAEAICEATIEVSADIRKMKPWSCSYLPFGPSVEKLKDNAFLPKHPEELVEEEGEDHVPLMIGVTDKEGIVFLAGIAEENYLEETVENPINAIISNVPCDDPKYLPHIAQKVKEFYFTNLQEKEKLPQFVNLYSDLFFMNLYDSLHYLAKAKQPVYVYQFTFCGELNPCSEETGPGPSHANDILYQFYNKVKFPNPNLGKAEKKMIHNICTLWSNFAKFGNPTPDAAQLGVVWKEYEINDPYYMNLSSELTLEKGYVWNPRRVFWNKTLKALSSNS